MTIPNTLQYLSTKPGFRRSRGSEVSLFCPRCDTRDSSRPHLFFNVEEGIGHCFRCDFNPSLYNLIKAFGDDRVNPQMSPQTTFRRVSLDYPELAHIDLPEYSRPIDDSERARPYLEYLLSRGFTRDDISSYNLYYCVTGRYKFRVIIPVTMFGDIVGFQGRSISATVEKKYDNPPGCDFGSLLFNFDTALSYETIILVEGVFDAIKTGRNSVATFGKKISENQLLLLTKHWQSVVLLWDSDANLDQVRITEYLRRFVRVKLGQLPFGSDPGGMDHSELVSVIDHAIDVSSDSDFIHFKLRSGRNQNGGLQIA